jgi:hypothetical protein
MGSVFDSPFSADEKGAAVQTAATVEVVTAQTRISRIVVFQEIL